MKKILILLSLTSASANVFAVDSVKHNGFFVTINNFTTQDANINEVATDNWNADDFDQGTVVPACSSKTFYTEAKKSAANSASLTLNVSGPYRAILMVSQNNENYDQYKQYTNYAKFLGTGFAVDTLGLLCGDGSGMYNCISPQYLYLSKNMNKDSSYAQESGVFTLRPKSPQQECALDQNIVNYTIASRFFHSLHDNPRLFTDKGVPLVDAKIVSLDNNGTSNLFNSDLPGAEGLRYIESPVAVIYNLESVPVALKDTVIPIKNGQAMSSTTNPTYSANGTTIGLICNYTNLNQNLSIPSYSSSYAVTNSTTITHGYKKDLKMETTGTVTALKDRYEQSLTVGTTFSWNTETSNATSSTEQETITIPSTSILLSPNSCKRVLYSVYSVPYTGKILISSKLPSKYTGYQQGFSTKIITGSNTSPGEYIIGGYMDQIFNGTKSGFLPSQFQIDNDGNVSINGEGTISSTGGKLYYIGYVTDVDPYTFQDISNTTTKLE